MRKIGSKTVVWKEGEYYVSLDTATSVSSFGETRQEALDMLEEALSLYFEDIPADSERRAACLD